MSSSQPLDGLDWREYGGLAQNFSILSNTSGYTMAFYRPHENKFDDHSFNKHSGKKTLANATRYSHRNQSLEMVPFRRAP
jgi:hypothetical protein